MTRDEEDLLYRALETEIGGIALYEHAMRLAIDPTLRDEWRAYATQTRRHERILREVFMALDLDAEKDTPLRRVARRLGATLLDAMATAARDASPEQAQIVAVECLVLAETTDHHNWKLLSELASKLEDDGAADLSKAVNQVEDEEDEHLEHATKWADELWLRLMGTHEGPPQEQPAKRRKKK